MYSVVITIINHIACVYFILGNSSLKLAALYERL